MILTVTPNPCVDKTFFVDRLVTGRKNYAPKYTCIPGGKGTNVARVVKSLGYETKAMVLVGGHTGAHIVDMIEHQDGIEVIPVWVQSPSRTITTILETEPHIQTPLFEPGSEVTDEEAVKFRDLFRDSLNGVDLVTFSGTVPSPALDDLYARLIKIAKERHILTILDSHGEAFAVGLGAGPFMVKPNVAEAEEVLGETLDSTEKRVAALKRFQEMGTGLAVISNGNEGAMVARDDTVLKCTPPQVDEVNPVGSGDALVAGFAVGLIEGMDLERICRLGVGAGTANATSWDIGHCSSEDIKQYASMVTIEAL